MHSEPAIAADPFTRACHAAGRRLVEAHGLLPAQVAWDADEVLWDWVIDARTIAAEPRSLLSRSLAHTQHLRFRPGMLSLLHGFVEAAAQRGHDARLRIWTNGWGSRVLDIAAAVPAFGQLLGAPATRPWPRVETLFTRRDFERAIALSTHPGAPGRGIVQRQLARDWTDSTFKNPWVAAEGGAQAMAAVDLLVDDTRANAERFARGGHRAVWLERAPRTDALAWTAHLTWGAPLAVLRAMGRRSATLGLADALARAAHAPAGSVLSARLAPCPSDADAVELALTFPHDEVSGEWREPARRLAVQRALPRRARSRLPG